MLPVIKCDGPVLSYRLKTLVFLLLLQSLPIVASFDLTGVPKCGLNCLITSLSTSACNSANSTCLCADAHYNDVVTTCVRANCTIRESLTTKNITWSGCGYPTSNRDSIINALFIVFVILTFLSFAARMTVKIMKLSPWGLDDSTICVSYACCVTFGAAAQLQAQAGLGRDIWTLRFDQITTFLKVFFIFEVLYTFALAMIKSSFLFFFLRIFPGRSFRIALWITVAFNALLGVTFVIVDLVQCRPVDAFWTTWDGEHTGSCININAMAWAHAGINVFLDIWMLALPAVQISGLHLSRRKKASVLVMFSVGAFLTAVSIVRLSSLVQFVDSTNVTVDYFGIALYSTLEIQVGVSCACMPAVYQLTMHIRRSVWPTLSRSGYGSSYEPGIKTIGSQSLRRRNLDASATLQTVVSRLNINSKPDGYEDHQPSQTCLVRTNNSAEPSSLEMEELSASGRG